MFVPASQWAESGSTSSDLELLPPRACSPAISVGSLSESLSPKTLTSGQSVSSDTGSSTEPRLAYSLPCQTLYWYVWKKQGDAWQMRTSEKTLGDCVCPSRGRLFPSPIWLWRTRGKSRPSRCRTALATVEALRSNAGPLETDDGSHDSLQKGRWEDRGGCVLRFYAIQLEVLVSLKLQLNAGQQCADIPTFTSTFTKQKYDGNHTFLPINGQNLLINYFTHWNCSDTHKAEIGGRQ